MGPYADMAQSLIRVSRRLAAHGWFPATSGNLSVRLPGPDHAILITKSGADKTKLRAQDLITVTATGEVAHGQGRPSAETQIHLALYEKTQAGAVFHVHTVYNNLVVNFAEQGRLVFKGQEMVKALGFWDDCAEVVVPIIKNQANIAAVAQDVRRQLVDGVPGVLLERHGIYAFGSTIADTLRHLEAFEFLFEWWYHEQMVHHLRAMNAL